jgi:NEDD4-binding protein 2
MAKICYILRGLVGTGKSMLANALGNEGSIFSTDSYFMVDGEYQFDSSKLGEYHARNLADATAFMERFAPYTNNVNCVIDNTNTQHWEYEKYVEAAKEQGFIGMRRTFLSMPSETLMAFPKKQFTEWRQGGNNE